MKYLLLLFVFVSVYVFGQDQPDSQLLEGSESKPDFHIGQQYRMAANGITLDSVVLFNDKKDEFIYNSKGFNIKTSFYVKVSGKWSLGYKEEYTYDSSDNFTSSSAYSCESNVCKGMSKVSRNFNEKGLVIEEYFYKPGDVSEWTATHKQEYLYDSNIEKLKKIIYYQGNSDGSNWFEVDSKEFFYNTNGSLDYTTKIGLTGSDNRTTYSYDISGRPLSEINYISYLSKIIDTQKVWLYEKSGEVLVVNSNLFSDYPSKTESRYDSLGNLLNTTRYNWNLSNQKILPTSKTEYYYNYNSPKNKIIFPGRYLGSVNPTNKIYGYKNYSWGGVEFIPSEQNEYLFYYSDGLVTSFLEKDETDKNVKIYPNPATENISLKAFNNSETIEFQLFDTNGQEMFFTKFSGHEEISVRELKKGFYLYRLNICYKVSCGKIQIK